MDFPWHSVCSLNYGQWGNMKTIFQKTLLRVQFFQNIVLNELLFLGGETKTRVSQIVIIHVHIFMSANLFYLETQTQGLRTSINSSLFDAEWKLLGCLIVTPTGQMSS